MLELRWIGDTRIAQELGCIEDRAATAGNVGDGALGPSLLGRVGQQLLHSQRGDGQPLGCGQSVVAVDHIGQAVHRAGPHLDHALGVGAPALDTLKRTLPLHAAGVHVALVLKVDRIAKDVGCSHHLLTRHQPVGQHRDAVVFKCRQPIKDVGLAELLELLAGHALDAAEQLRAVAWAGQASELSGGQRLPLLAKGHHRLGQVGGWCSSHVEAGAGVHLQGRASLH